MLRGQIELAVNAETERIAVLLTRNTNTVEPLVVTPSRKRPSLVSDLFAKIPKDSQPNPYIWNLLRATTSRKRPRPLLE